MCCKWHNSWDTYISPGPDETRQAWKPQRNVLCEPKKKKKKVISGIPYQFTRSYSYDKFSTSKTVSKSWVYSTGVDLFWLADSSYLTVQLQILTLHWIKKLGLWDWINQRIYWKHCILGSSHSPKVMLDLMTTSEINI